MYQISSLNIIIIKARVSTSKQNMYNIRVERKNDHLHSIRRVIINEQ